MKKIYKLLGLENYRYLGYSLTNDKIIKNCKKESQIKSFNNIKMNIENMILGYSVKMKNVLECDYEIQTIIIELLEPRQYKNIVNVFDDIIPYSMILVFKSKDKYLISYNYKDNLDKFSNKHILETDWIYEEEVEWLLCDDNQDYSFIKVLSHNDIVFNINNIIDYIENSEYLCLRRAINMMLISNAKYDGIRQDKILTELYESDNIEYYNDHQFVSMERLQNLYEYTEDGYWKKKIVDSRISANNRFIDANILSIDDMNRLWNKFIYKYKSDEEVEDLI